MREYIANHKEAKQFCNATLENYEVLDEIFSAVVANGEYSFSSLGFQSPTSSPMRTAESLTQIDSTTDSDVFNDDNEESIPSPATPTLNQRKASTIRKSPRKRIRVNSMALAMQEMAKSHARHAGLKAQPPTFVITVAINQFQKDFETLDPIL
jgi:hypothetical protein